MKPTIDEILVRKMITDPFPQWKDLPVSAVSTSGWDNRTFHLGDEMLVRLPSAPEYAEQVEKEQRWLPKLAPLLPLQIPTPLAMGKPTNDYPHPWSIYRWIEAETAAFLNTLSLDQFSVDLAKFLVALQKIDTQDAPLPGQHNFYRGGDSSIYDEETQKALSLLN